MPDNRWMLPALRDSCSSATNAVCRASGPVYERRQFRVPASCQLPLKVTSQQLLLLLRLFSALCWLQETNILLHGYVWYAAIVKR